MKKNQNNKGFTLVELIIVIAVLAILMVALVPQYIKYVERAHESNDTTVASSIVNAAEIAVVDPQNGVSTGETYIVTWDTTDDGEITVVSSTNEVDANASDLQTEIQGVVGEEVEAESAAAAGEDFVFTITADGVVSITSDLSGLYTE